MWAWYRLSSTAEGEGQFVKFVPALPDYLSAGWVLRQFRWCGDEEGDEDEGDAEERRSGAVFACAWRFRWELVKILGFAVVWIVSIFISPLSMNLVSRGPAFQSRSALTHLRVQQLLSYVQDRTDTRVSPYLFVVGIFLGPVAASVAFQNATYRLGQIGLRLRALLGHAVYKKLLRVKAGGGGSKDDDEEVGKDGEESPQTGVAGAEAVGRVNSKCARR